MTFIIAAQFAHAAHYAHSVGLLCGEWKYISCIDDLCGHGVFGLTPQTVVAYGPFASNNDAWAAYNRAVLLGFPVTTVWSV